MKIEATPEVQRAFDDLHSTHGKNGIPPLPAVEEPTKPIRSPRTVKDGKVVPAPAPDSAPTENPRRSAKLRRSRQGSNADLTAIVYATKDQPSCGGHVVERSPTEIVVNNGLALVALPLAEEGRTWVYLHIMEESARLGAQIKLDPAHVRVLAEARSHVQDTWLGPDETGFLVEKHGCLKDGKGPKGSTSSMEYPPVSGHNWNRIDWLHLEFHAQGLYDAVLARDQSRALNFLAFFSRLAREV